MPPVLWRSCNKKEKKCVCLHEILQFRLEYVSILSNGCIFLGLFQRHPGVKYYQAKSEYQYILWRPSLCSLRVHLFIYFLCPLRSSSAHAHLIINLSKEYFFSSVVGRMIFLQQLWGKAISSMVKRQKRYEGWV